MQSAQQMESKRPLYDPLGPPTNSPAEIDYDQIAMKTAAIVKQRLDLDRFSQSLERVRDLIPIF